MNDTHELIEAERACERSLGRIDAALSHLNSAKSWGMFDMFGGGFLTSYIKTNKIDKAEKEMAPLREELKILYETSEEIKGSLNDFEELDSLQKTLDIGLDDIHSNWKTQDQLKKNIELLEGLRETLVELEGSLSFKSTDA